MSQLARNISHSYIRLLPCPAVSCMTGLVPLKPSQQQTLTWLLPHCFIGLLRNQLGWSASLWGERSGWPADLLTRRCLTKTEVDPKWRWGGFRELTFELQTMKSNLQWLQCNLQWQKNGPKVNFWQGQSCWLFKELFINFILELLNQFKHLYTTWEHLKALCEILVS